MATEETELAFIRCPGCRSLVPSVATRCRMCGEPLQAKKEAAPTPSSEGGESTRKMRIRQRTSNVNQGEAEGGRAEVVSPVRSSPAEERAPVEEYSAPTPVASEREQYQDYSATQYEYHEEAPTRTESPVAERWSEAEPEPEPYIQADTANSHARSDRSSYHESSWDGRQSEPQYEEPHRSKTQGRVEVPQRRGTTGAQGGTAANERQSRGSSFRLDVRRRQGTQAEAPRHAAPQEGQRYEERPTQAPAAPYHEESWGETGRRADRRQERASQPEGREPAREPAREPVRAPEPSRNAQHQPQYREEPREQRQYTEAPRRESWGEAMQGSGQFNETARYEPSRSEAPRVDSYREERAPESVARATPVVTPRVEATSQVQHIEVEEEYSDYSDQGEGDESSSDFGQPFEGEEVGSHGEPKKKRKRKRKKKKPVEAVGMQSQHVGVVEQPMAPAGQGFIKTNSREGMSYTGEVEAESVQRTEPVFTPEPVYAAEPVYAPEPPYRAEPVYNAEPVYQPEVRYQEPAPRVLDTRSGGEPELDVVQGLLLGWFVIYDQSGKGVAREIHSGRFFVGGAQLRDSDFVLVHPSVSTPHCLVNCIPGDGVKVLDLMSERGTYVKRRGTNAYVRHAEQVTLAHGDWVRFGSFEVLVCLIPA